jgi:hypothetical protein
VATVSTTASQKFLTAALGNDALKIDIQRHMKEHKNAFQSLLELSISSLQSCGARTPPRDTRPDWEGIAETSVVCQQNSLKKT